MGFVFGVTGGATAVIAAAAAVLAFGVSWMVAVKVVRRSERSRVYDTSLRLGLEQPEDGVGDNIEWLMMAIDRSVREMRAESVEAGAENSRLQEAMDSLPEAVLVFDNGASIVGRNTAAEVFIEARHSDALISAAVTELVADALVGRSSSRTIELFGPPRRTVVITTNPLKSGSGTGAVAIIEDITERRRLEAVRTDFVANISHELKTPVGAISLLAETLLAEDDPAVADRLANRILSEAIRVGHTIQDLLELSQIEIDEPAEFNIVDIGDLAAEAADRIRPAAEQASITINLTGSASALSVRGDRRQLLSAISNLLDNALKYSDKGSAIDVFTTVESSEVLIAIVDRGIGIPARDIERVFERFYRVDQARSRQTGGTGLGLAIVRHVAVNHRGTVDVESRLGEGSRFTLRLPALESIDPDDFGPSVFDPEIFDSNQSSNLEPGRLFS
ncbi:BaeS Signal transduction histidine kinase [Acidimicrobiia bacterium]